MIDQEKIKYYIGIFRNFELKDFTSIFKLVSIKRLKRNQIYIAEGVNYRKIAYIKKGLIRAFIIKDNGEEITTFIRWEDQFISSHDSILFNQPSRFVYEAIENSILLEVDYDIAQRFIEKNPKLEQSRKHFLHNMLGEFITRIESFVLLTPEERYVEFVENNPQIINRIPSKYIATLLGITPVSLSRIKARMAKKMKSA